MALALCSIQTCRVKMMIYTVYASHSLIFLFVLSSACKAGNGEVEKDSLSASGQAAPECDRHTYKSVLEGGDIPLQGLRALNKRHPSTSYKGRLHFTYIYRVSNVIQVWNYFDLRIYIRNHTTLF